jgi:hypothetical protein
VSSSRKIQPDVAFSRRVSLLSEDIPQDPQRFMVLWTLRRPSLVSSLIWTVCQSGERICIDRPHLGGEDVILVLEFRENLKTFEWITFQTQINGSRNVTEQVGIAVALDPYSGGAWIESRPGHRLS